MKRAAAAVGMLMGAVVIASFFVPWLVHEESSNKASGYEIASLAGEKPFQDFGGKTLVRTVYLVPLGGLFLTVGSAISFFKRGPLPFLPLILGVVLFIIGNSLLFFILMASSEELPIGLGKGFYMQISGFFLGTIAAFLSMRGKEEHISVAERAFPECPNCGAELEPDSKYCTECGTAVEERN